MDCTSLQAVQSNQCLFSSRVVGLSFVQFQAEIGVDYFIIWKGEEYNTKNTVPTMRQL